MWSRKIYKKNFLLENKMRDFMNLKFFIVKKSLGLISKFSFWESTFKLIKFTVWNVKLICSSAITHKENEKNSDLLKIIYFNFLRRK